MRFLIIGDVHCYGHYVFEAIKQVGKNGPIDAVVCTGDLTNTGGQIEVESVAAAVKSGLEGIGSTAPFIAAMGNHDYGNKVNSDEENALCRARFESVVGIPYRSVTKVKGYTFITFSARNHSANYTEEDYIWLDEQLTIAQKDGLPAFVVCHYSSGTLGLYGDGGNKKGGRLDDVLKKHPQAVLLSGHSHAFLANERSFMQSESGYHSINAGSLWQSAKWDNITGNVVGHYLPVVIVARCDAATLSMERVDVIQQKAIGKPWIIAPDVDNSIAARAKRAPQMRFAEGDLQITNVGPCAALISYPQASGEVEYYLATATDNDGEQVSAQFTSYYYLPREGRGSMTIDGLTPDCDYTLTLCPVDFYGNQGTSLTARFKTTPAVPTFNEVLYEGPILAEMWTGDTDFIRDEVGFATDSDDVRPFIISQNSFDLGSSFEVFTHNHRNRYNNSDDDFSCLQVGRYTAATCRTRDDNRVAILDGWQIGDGNPFESDRVIATTKLPYTIESGTVGLTLKDGTLTMWRDDLPALTVAAEGFSAPVKVALQLGETWGVFKNCAYFDSISVLK